MHEVSRLDIQLLDLNGENVTAEWRFESNSGAAVRIGRAHDNDVILSDRFVSRYHAEISFTDGCWRVINLGRHGTFHGGEPIDAAHVLRAGRHELQLGGTGMILRLNVAARDVANPPTQADLTTTLFIDRAIPILIAIDEDDKSRTVDEIANGEFFQALQIARQRLAAEKGMQTSAARQ